MVTSIFIFHFQIISYCYVGSCDGGDIRILLVVPIQYLLRLNASDVWALGNL